MSKKPTINTVTAGYNSASALNTALQALADAFDNTVSRDGSIPNVMSADFDMGNNDILNAKDIYAAKLYAAGVRITDAVAVPDWKGAWVTATSYVVNDLVRQDGSAYICIEAHTSGTFSTDLSASKWELFAQKGAAGAGTGDMVAANNLSDVADAATSRSNLGLSNLATTTASAFALTLLDDADSAAARSTLGLGGLATLDIIDEDNMASDLATRPPSQQSVKAFVENSVVNPGTVFLQAVEPAGTESEIDIAVPSTYGVVSIEVVGLNHNNSTDRNLQVLFSTDGGSTFLSSGNYEWRRDGTTSTAQNEIEISGNHDREVGHGVHGEIKIFGHGRTDTRTGLISRIFIFDGIDIDGPFNTVGKLLATTAVTHVRLTFEGRTFRNEGIVLVRGYKVS